MSIYLDAAATTQPKPEVVEAMMPYFTEKYYNPSSLYSAAVEVKKDIEQARQTIADFIDAEPNEIYFTSSGSEGNNWAIQGFVNYWRSIKTPIVVTSEIEHKSIMSCFEDDDIIVKRAMPVNSEGFVDIEELEHTLKNYNDIFNCKILVSIQFANNEIGTIQHIQKIAALAHKYGAVFHTDAVQAFGHIPINVKELGIDMLTASGHKIGCPKGIGILYKNSKTPIKPLIYGSQMNGMRGGTENVPYIIGMAKAVDIAKDDIVNQSNIRSVRDYFIDKLESIGCKLNGSKYDRLFNNINVILPDGVGGEEMMYMLDLSGIQCSTGSACNSRSKEPSHVLKAINLSDEEAARSIRMTISSDITFDDVDIVINEMKKQFELVNVQ